MDPSSEPPWRVLDAPPASAATPSSGSTPAAGNPGGIVLDPGIVRLAALVTGVMGCAVVAIVLAMGGGAPSVTVAGTEGLPVSGSPDGAAGTGAAASPLRDELVVEIVGAVLRPGVYRVPSGSRIGDLVAMAGGFGPRIDTARAERELHLAEPLRDGIQVRVPSRDDPPAAGPTATEAPSGGSTGVRPVTDRSTSTTPRRPSSRACPGSGRSRPARSSPPARRRRSRPSTSCARAASSGRRPSSSCATWSSRPEVPRSGWLALGACIGALAASGGDDGRVAVLCLLAAAGLLVGSTWLRATRRPAALALAIGMVALVIRASLGPAPANLTRRTRDDRAVVDGRRERRVAAGGPADRHAAHRGRRAGRIPGRRDAAPLPRHRARRPGDRRRARQTAPGQSVRPLPRTHRGVGHARCQVAGAARPTDRSRARSWRAGGATRATP